jgi:NAD(P)-dependent dehydrogenase (short-subunit alcohol dehydrogenase family)
MLGFRDLVGGFMAYSQSKTANILFTVALARRLADARAGFAFSLHPGTIRTPLVMDSIFGMLSFLPLSLIFF